MTQPRFLACVMCGLKPLSMFRARRVRGGLELVRCPRCGLLQLSDDSRRKAAVAAEQGLYAQGYYDAWGLGEERAGLEHLRRIKRVTFGRSLGLVRRFVPPPGPLLDIGCSLGLLLEQARELGYEVAGVEPSAFALQQARSRLGPSAELYHGDAFEAALAPGRFGAITLFDVLEHTAEPRALLRRCRELLRPGGVVAVILPHADAVSAQIMGAGWTHYKLEHVAYYGRAQLRAVLASEGFAVVHETAALKGLSVSYLREHLATYRTPVFSKLFRFADGVLPASLRHRPWLLPSGELLVIAEAR